MKLSILDQAPILEGYTAQEALQQTVELAKLGDELGYTRYWVAEHHDMQGLACPAPEIMLGIIGANTKRIRIGAGAILLPHYKPYKVAETFNVLATLYPGRVDLGIGRSPGGSAEASVALSGNFLENVRRMPELLDELLHFFHGDFDKGHMFSKINLAPVPEVMPETWLLGTSEKSAILAAEKGLSYAFGHFMSDQNAGPIIRTYKKQMTEKQNGKQPNIIMAVNVICAGTTEEAERIALRSYKSRKASLHSSQNDAPLTEEEKTEFKAYLKKMIIGSPEDIKQQLLALQDIHQVNEFMILTNTPTLETRTRSYQLIAKEIL